MYFVVFASRQDSYDESLNPFGDDEKPSGENENSNAENKNISK